MVRKFTCDSNTFTDIKESYRQVLAIMAARNPAVANEIRVQVYHCQAIRICSGRFYPMSRNCHEIDKIEISW